MKVLITGGCGFIGSHIAEHFSRSGDEVVVLDSLRTGHRSNLDGFQGVRLVEGSVTDAELVKELAAGAQWIFHLAAMVSVPESMERPWECVEINVKGTLNVLEAARANNVKKVVLSSTSATYGDEPEPFKREDLRPAPKTPYGITKLDGEHYLQMYREQFGVPTCSLRYFNVFGPRQDPKSQYAAAIPIFVERAVSGRELGIYGDGLQTRDFVYVKDVVAANVLAASREEMAGVFNVARGESITIKELAEIIVRKVGSSSPIKHLPERAGDIRHSVADVSKIKAMGFAPGTNLDQGLDTTIQFFRERQVPSVP